MLADRLLASLGSAIGNFTMFSAILSGWHPPARCCRIVSVEPRPATVFELGRFKPYIIDFGSYGWPVRNGPQCPKPEADTWLYDLADAPLPPSFDPMARSARRMSACVRLDSAGKVQGVTLIGVLDPDVADALIVTIHRQWRFERIYRSLLDYDARREGWIRVRINDGAPELPGMTREFITE